MSFEGMTKREALECIAELEAELQKQKSIVDAVIDSVLERFSHESDRE